MNAPGVGRGGAAALLPVILMTALLAVLPWLEGGASPTGLFITHTLVFLLLGAVVVLGRLERRVTLGFGWEAPAALGLLAVCFLSFLAVDYRYGPFLSLWNLLVAILFAGAVMMLGHRPGLIPQRVIALTSAAQAIAVFVMPVPPNMTASGTFANANQLAAYLNVGTFFAAGLAVSAWKERSWWRVGIAIAVALVDIAAVLRVGARGALLALLVVGALGALLSVPRGSRRLRTALWSALIVLAILAAVAVASRFERIGDPYRFDRVRIWKAGLDAAADHPILGMGPGMFSRRGYRYNFPLDREMFRYSKMPGSTHSTYFQTLAETGIAGFAAMTLLVGILGWRLWQHRADPVVLALFACLAQGFVDTPFDVPAVTLSLIAVVVPLLASADPRRVPFFAQLEWPRGRASLPVLLALGGALGQAWLGGALLPYVAWSRYMNGNLDSAIRLDGWNPLYHAARAESVWRRGVPLDPPTLAAAHFDLDEARRLDPGNPEYALRLAQLHARACFEIAADPTAVARAERLYRRAIALGLKDPRPRLELATFLLAQGRSSEGIEEIRAALEIEPRYLGARSALVKALLEAGLRDEAAAEQSRLNEIRAELDRYVPKNGYEKDLMLIQLSGQSSSGGFFGEGVIGNLPSSSS